MSAVAIEGELTVRLDWDGRRVRSASVRSTRPLAVGRVLCGRTPAVAAQTVPRLFGICANAQAAAAAGACEAASGVVPDAATVEARAAAVLLETIQEVLRRVLIDWPEALGVDAEAAAVASARRAIAPVLARLAAVGGRTDGAVPDRGAAAIPRILADTLDALLAERVLGMPAERWLALGVDGVDAWAASGSVLPARLLARMSTSPQRGASDIALMPDASRAALCAHVVPGMRADEGFGRAPTWSGAPMETGALARMRALPLCAALRAREGSTARARMVARLAELAVAVGRVGAPPDAADAAPIADAFALADGEGLGAVQTARGLLLHRVEADDARVVRYQIVAPTEWNFHPEGALVRSLDGAEAPDEPTLVREARLAVQALDPCVECRVELGRGEATGPRRPASEAS